MGLLNIAIRRQVVSGRGPQSVRYANGVTHSQWVSERFDPQTGGQRTASAVCAICERCDPQSVGLPNVVIRRQMVSGRGPQSVRYANGVSHSQWVCQTL